jgi:hypothetical protein
MNFVVREARLSDLPACARLLSSRFLTDPDRPEHLQQMWSEIVVSQNGTGVVAMDGAQPGDVVYFAFMAFVTDRCADEYQRGIEPLIARRILRQWAAGERPFLSVAEIARANAGPGVNGLVMQYGGVTGDEQRTIAANYECGQRVLLGWNFRSFTAQVFPRVPERNLASWGRSLGYRVKEYSPEQLSASGIPKGEAPCLWFSTGKDIQGNTGFAAALLFGSYARPRCGFTPKEQQTLRRALEGNTDEQIGRLDSISLATAKKRFRAVYEKAQAAIPEEFAETQPRAEGFRGAERRRRLLVYVREHPEELRPYDAEGRVEPALPA